MKILIVSATKFEIAPLLKHLGKIRTKKHKIDVLITGIGMTSTAFHLGKTLHKKYDLAINTGVAGSFRRNIPLGTVANVVSDSFADLGTEDGEKFLTLKEMRLGKVPSLKSHPDSYRDQNSKVKKALEGIKKVKGITVNTVHGNSASIKKVVKKFNPDIESMEGAAFFFACGHEKIPCLQVRAISNYVERRNKKNWKLDLAIKNLCISIEQILKAL